MPAVVMTNAEMGREGRWDVPHYVGTLKQKQEAITKAKERLQQAEVGLKQAEDALVQEQERLSVLHAKQGELFPLEIQEVALKDNRGEELAPEQTVVYNWQGQVACGIIKSIKMGKRYGRPTPRIKIQMTHPEQRESVVTDEKNLMVIHETKPLTHPTQGELAS